jgi:prepilin-type N-terminal cleavage/methylation domain-containing protein
MGPRSGFTLIELVSTILVLGILSAVAVPYFIDMRDDAKSAVTRDEMAALKRAIVGDSRVVAGGRLAFPGYEADMGALPTGLVDLVLNPATGTTVQDYNPLTRRGWRGPYVDNASVSDYSKDAWGTTYVYSAASRRIRSWGPNVTDDSGGSDDIDLNF